MQRSTELRHLSPDLKYKISNYLEENDCWKRLMSIVPKNADGSEEKKYTNEQINLIASPRQGDSRRSAEIFLEEWATSGRKEQRPTLGTLIQLLQKAELYGVADYVAEILNEPPPQRPSKGPGARVDIELPSAIFHDVDSYACDSEFYPNSEDIKENGAHTNGVPEINHDFYTKHRTNEKNLQAELAPKPMPRTYRRSERLQNLEQKQNSPSSPNVTNKSPLTTTTIVNGSVLCELRTETCSNIASQGLLNVSFTDNEETQLRADPSLPLISMLLSDHKCESAVPDSNSVDIVNATQLPLLSALQTDFSMSDSDRLPVISALNIECNTNKEQADETNVANVPTNTYFDNDDLNCIDEDEDSSRNVDSSNNDSSLTNVTGTSGDNSFELSSSSTSNENIPLNVLNFTR